MNTVLITGANRGIGLGFCQQYAQQGWQVLACCRHPEQADELNYLCENTSLIIHKMDVMNRKAIDALANELENVTIDLVIANASVYGDSQDSGFGHIHYQDWMSTFETNVLGVVKVLEAFMPNLKQSKQARVAVLSSQIGSIGDNGSGGSLLYRSSKAALNAVMKSLAINLNSDGVGVSTQEKLI
jgi:NAD(P)-dependent dehydrogenase (short-subunit alcohol dehydrogenase family)